MKEFTNKGSYTEVILENDKKVKISTRYLDNMIEKLDITVEDAIMTWLEDEGYLTNDEQLELCKQAKENKATKVVSARGEVSVKKTPKERVAKDNPTKEMIISKVAEMLNSIAEDVNIENKGKLITFKLGNDEFKLDLVQKRKKKEEK